MHPTEHITRSTTSWYRTNRFRSGIHSAKTRTFPGADVGSDHNLVILNFRFRLNKIKKHMNSRLKFNLDRLKDPSIHESFQATEGGEFAALLTLDDGAEALVTKFCAEITETTDEILGGKRREAQPWVTDKILDLCDQRRNRKKAKNTTNGTEACREVS